MSSYFNTREKALTAFYGDKGEDKLKQIVADSKAKMSGETSKDKIILVQGAIS